MRRLKRWRAGLAVGAMTAAGLVSIAPPAHADTDSREADETESDREEELEDSEGDPVESTVWGDVSAREEQQTLSSTGAWAAARDVHSLFSLTAAHGIQRLWAEGVTGKKVTVALIDTGVAPVPGLVADKDKVMDGPDLSFDSQSEGARYVDGFGHGTHLAGIIGGQDQGWDRKKPHPSVFAGVAPEAQILNLKVGAADGGADVSQVIAALDWIVEHKKKSGMRIRVAALAYGTATPQPWQVDPLARAVENAWRAGIVVVTAAGNDGLDAPLLMPAVDPHVLAVGAIDPNGTQTLADDQVAPFSSGGDAQRRPDVVAPGRSVVSLRVPGSYADTMSPEGRVTGDTSGRFFRGSGTSQAVAFVAGQVALLLDERSKLSPDEVKALLVHTARPLDRRHPAMGAGVVDLPAALRAPVPEVRRTLPYAQGTGSLEASRGGEHVIDPLTGAKLTGEVDAMGAPWNAEEWLEDVEEGETWDDGQWNGRSWAGEKFKKNQADREQWQPAPWSGESWAGVPWDRHPQSPARWEARSWRGDNWEARSWRDDSWHGRSWRGRSWRALF